MSSSCGVVRLLCIKETCAKYGSVNVLGGVQEGQADILSLCPSVVNRCSVS